MLLSAVAGCSDGLSRSSGVRVRIARTGPGRRSKASLQRHAHLSRLRSMHTTTSTTYPLPQYLEPYCCSYSPSGDLLFVGCEDGTGWLRAQTSQQQQSIHLCEDPIYDSGWLAREQLVCASGDQGGVACLDVSRMQVLHRLHHKSPDRPSVVRVVATRPDDAHLVATGTRNGVVRVWDVRTSAQKPALHWQRSVPGRRKRSRRSARAVAASTTGLCFAGGEHTVVAGFSNSATLHVLDTRAVDQPRTVKVSRGDRPVGGRDYGVWSLSTHPRQSGVLVCSLMDGTTHFVDPQCTRPLRSFGGATGSFWGRSTVSACGQYLAVPDRRGPVCLYWVGGKPRRPGIDEQLELPCHRLTSLHAVTVAWSPVATALTVCQVSWKGSVCVFAPSLGFSIQRDAHTHSRTAESAHRDTVHAPRHPAGSSVTVSDGTVNGTTTTSTRSDAVAPVRASVAATDGLSGGAGGNSVPRVAVGSNGHRGPNDAAAAPGGTVNPIPTSAYLDSVGSSRSSPLEGKMALRISSLEGSLDGNVPSRWWKDAVELRPYTSQRRLYTSQRSVHLGHTTACADHGPVWSAEGGDEGRRVTHAPSPCVWESPERPRVTRTAVKSSILDFFGPERPGHAPAPTPLPPTTARCVPTVRRKSTITAYFTPRQDE